MKRIILYSLLMGTAFGMENKHSHQKTIKSAKQLVKYGQAIVEIGAGIPVGLGITFGSALIADKLVDIAFKKTKNTRGGVLGFIGFGSIIFLGYVGGVITGGTLIDKGLNDWNIAHKYDRIKEVDRPKHSR